MLELYHGGTSVCSVKVRLVLAEKGLDWQSHYLSLTRREHGLPPLTGPVSMLVQKGFEGRPDPAGALQ